MRRWVFAVILCVWSAGNLPAQTPDAKAVAARVDHHYNSLRSLSVAFDESYAGMGIHREESGTLLLRKPGRMRWNYSEPKGKVFLLDGKFAYSYTPGDPQAQRISEKQLDDLRSPLRFLLGHTQLEKELTGLKVSAGQSNGVYILSGVPQGDSWQIAHLTLQVAGDGAIHRMKIEEADGATTTFTFSNEVPNAPAPDAGFIFRAPANVSIVQGLPPV